MERKVYFDHTAATYVLPEVLQAMIPFFHEHFGNPQSPHPWGDRAREAMEEARERVAGLLEADPQEIIFTSSGTEANNLAVKGLALAYQNKGRHIVVSAIEHFSVLHSVRTLAKGGFEFTAVPVDSQGMVDPDDVKKAIRDDTILVSIIHASSEVGTIQALEEIARVVKERGVLFHTDAVASAGQIPIDVHGMGIDALSLSAQTFYGPKGAGALYLRKGLRLIPLMDGGIQEGGRRPGTENVPAIVGMGKAAELALQSMGERAQRLCGLRDKLIRGVLDRVEHTFLTGHPEQRLPGHASFCVRFIEGEAMLMLLAAKGIAASSGSACTSKALKASHVLTAMGISPEDAQGSLMLTLALGNKEEEVDYFLEVLPSIVGRLREMSPLWDKFKKGG